MANYIYGYYMLPAQSLENPKKITDIMNKLSESGCEIVTFRGSVIYFKKLKPTNQNEPS